MTNKSSGELPDGGEALRRMQEESERRPGISLSAARAGVGPGWQDLVEQAWNAVTGAGGRVLQTKEKFGGLRVYYDRVSPDSAAQVDASVSKLVVEASHTCEWCGAPGERRDRGYAQALGDLRGGRYWWYKTLCDEHAWRFYADHERWWYPPAWSEELGG